ncbi:Electron transfer flavoprotein regulatory factor 1-like [Homarus americanus]|uniref:Electron transfer flavoprotein regulatory factor 1-like n=1 Tax=Homarus americanus TaxID=6706 RepID=A0A8J5J922_HOMAM|nr:Electron transfer flavoprotein regulatory factor 1-like [Homarus americanus]
MPRHSYKVVEFETKLCPKTIASWFSFMREVCLYYCEENSRILGGPGCIVEIGEAKVGKRKYNKGRIIEGQWVLGGLERNSKKIFLVTIPDRTEETLLEVIRQWIIKGTKIVSNCWSSYRKLTLDGYTQESVNNCLNIVNPESGESTQIIEWVKGDDQDIVPKFGREEEQFEGHLATAIFQKIFPDLAERFHHFLLATAALYPPTNEVPKVTLEMGDLGSELIQQQKKLPAMSLRPQVVQLYKNLLYLGREYPLGYDYFREKLKNAFIKNKDVTDPEQIKMMIGRGEFVIKEIEALYMLRKYRTMKRRYYDNENNYRVNKDAQ